MNSDFVDTEIQIRYADIDSLNHVNNATFLTYLEMGRINFFHSKLGAEFFDNHMMVMARMEIDYLATIMLGDRVKCRTWIQKVGKTSITFGNAISKNDGIMCAKALSVAVLVDLQGNKLAVPENIRELVIQDGSIM